MDALVWAITELLESDYCRIEITLQARGKRAAPTLESDYCRIEIRKTYKEIGKTIGVRIGLL